MPETVPRPGTRARAAVLVGLLLSVAALVLPAQEATERSRSSPGARDRDLTTGVSAPRLPAGETELAPVSSAVHNALQLVLDLLPGYRVQALPAHTPSDVPLEREFARRVALEHELDLVVFSELSPADPDGYEITFVVYDAARDEFAFEAERRTDRLLELFEVADELSTEVAGGVLGEPASFGMLSLQPRGYAFEYRVELEGSVIEDSPRSIGPVLAGTRRVRVEVAHSAEHSPEPEAAESEAPERTEFVVFDRDVSVPRDAAVELRFGIPAYPPSARRSRIEDDSHDLQARMQDQTASTTSSAEIPEVLRSIPSVLRPQRAVTDTPESREALRSRYLARRFVTVEDGFLHYAPHELDPDGRFTAEGGIAGTRIAVESRSVVVSRPDENYLRITESTEGTPSGVDDRTGLEFRAFGDLTEPGRYHLSRSVGVRKPSILLRAADEMAVAASSATIEIMRFDDEWLIGAYRIENPRYDIELEGRFSIPTDSGRLSEF